MNEPTNNELAAQGWSQPPDDGLPEGANAFEKLDVARGSYNEVPQQPVIGFALMSRRLELCDYIKQGDITPETAARLTAAKKSRVFDRTFVLLPTAKYALVAEAAVIGVINVAAGDLRYFYLQEPSHAWDNQQLAERARVMGRNAGICLVSAMLATIALFVLALVLSPVWLLGLFVSVMLCSVFIGALERIDAP